MEKNGSTKIIEKKPEEKEVWLDSHGVTTNKNKQEKIERSAKYRGDLIKFAMVIDKILE
jgi:hypothetical protein